MKQVTVEAITEAVGGRLLWGEPGTQVSHVSFDSRECKEQMLFVPLVGEKADGHDFIPSAFEHGAVAAFTSRHEAEEVAEQLRDYAWIRVEDTREALQRLAGWYRKKIAIPIVGITGSVGKTTTRAMVAEALSGSRSVYQTKGNLNSQIGVPVMLLETGDEEISVLEMGMSEFGEMDRLTRMVRPELAVITCVGVAHIEQLGSRENICKEKMAIAHGMPPDGLLLLNGDDDMLAGKRGSIPQRVCYYGTGEDCEFRAENICIEDGRARFDAVYGEKRIPVSLAMPGRHNVLNALAALAVCELTGASMEAGAGRLEAFRGVAMRQQIDTVNGYTVIDDSYNANPDSMKAGLRVLAEYPATGRRVAVLGDMLELGKREADFHREIGSFVAELGIAQLCTFGELAGNIDLAARAADQRLSVRHFETREELTLFLKELLQPGDAVLLKGSRGMQLNLVAEELRRISK